MGKGNIVMGIFGNMYNIYRSKNKIQRIKGE